MDEPRDVMAGTRVVIRKFALAIVLLVVVGIVVFWIAWVRAPSPEEICRHKIDLVLATVGEDQADGADALIGQLELKCVDAAKRKIRLRGKLVYADYAKCVIGAETLMDAERC